MSLYAESTSDGFLAYLFEWPVMARTLCYVSGWFAFVGGGEDLLCFSYLVFLTIYKSLLNI